MQGIWLRISFLIENFIQNQKRGPSLLDSNNFSIGIHFFKVLVQIHYSRSPSTTILLFDPKIGFFRPHFLNEILGAKKVQKMAIFREH